MKMSLRTKTLLAISILLTVLFALLFITISRLLLDGFNRVEDQVARDNVKRVLNLLDRETQNLSTTAGDYSQWNDTYDFVVDRNLQFVEENFSLNTFAAQKLDVVVVADVNRNVVLARAADAEYREIQDAPLEVLATLTAADSSFWPDDESGEKTGVIILPGKSPLLVAVRPILKSDSLGPSRGALLMGRYLDEAWVRQMSELTELAITIHTLESLHDLPDDFRSAYDNLVTNGTARQTPSQGIIAQYAFYSDVNGTPVMIVRVDTPRDVSRQAQVTTRYLFIFLAIVAMVFSGGTLWLLERMVLARLAQLSEEVSYIGVSGDPSARVGSLPGQDELSGFAETINATLEALERSQERLRDSETQLRRITDSMSDLIFYMDSEGRLQYVSPSHRWVLGYEPTEMLGHYGIDFLEPEDAPSFVRYLQEVLAQGHAARFEFRARHSDGSVVWLESNVNIMMTENDEIIGLTFSARDVTARKQAEEQIRQLNEDLKQALRQEQTTRAQLVQAGKLSAMGRMVASVAHELNNPLQTIKNCLYLLQQDIGPQMETNEFMLTVLSEIHRLSDLVGQLRAVYRPPSADQVQRLDLRTLVDEVHGLVTPHLQKNRVQWEQVPAPAPLWVRGIGDQLKQVFLNIVLNAVDAMQPAGGLLAVGLKEEDSAWLGVVFEDSGPGIDPQLLTNLFEPFFTTKDAGMGLGLAISYDIVQKHGGRMEVQNRSEGGARFIVWLSPDDKSADLERSKEDLELERSSDHGSERDYSHRR